MPTKPKQPTATQITERLDEAGIYADQVYKRNGKFVVRFIFFYTHGRTANGYALEIQKAIPEAQITDQGEYWNTWPKDSYFEVRFTI